MISEFIGVPYKPLGRDMTGLDCWGLCLVVGKRMFNLDLPEYFYDERTILQDAASHIASELTQSHWEKLAAPEPGAIGIFRVFGGAHHCGMFLNHETFIHTLEGRNVTIASVSDPEWSRRLVDVRRWVHHD